MEQALVPAGGTSKVTTGIQKLAQQWLVEMMTVRGSVPYQPERGTFLILRARQGRLRTTLAVEQAFAVARMQARQNLMADETDQTPDDERYGRVDLLSVSLEQARASIRARLRSRAGEDRELILPLAASIS
jgi:hypothetical protein